MTAWMIWATVVTFVLATAGLALERALRALGRPARFAWLAAGLAAAGVMVWSRTAGKASTAPSAGAGTVETLTADLLRELATAVPSAPGGMERIDAVLGWGWAAATALLILALGGGLWRLSRRARSWPAARVPGGEVLLSDGFGPALVGLRSPRIVVPRWLLGLGAEPLRMAYLHEAEHRRTGDGLLLLASALLTAAAPWNPGLWWIHRRLRTAVEMDCDERVLDAGVHPVRYGSLLLEIGTRATHVPRMVAAFARPRSTLERRMTMIVREKDERMGVGRVGRASAAVAVAALLVAVACETPAPTQVGSDEQVAAEEAADAAMDVTLRPDGGADAAKESFLRIRAEGDQADTPFGDARVAAPEGVVGEAQIRLKATGPLAEPLIFIDGVRQDGDVATLADLSPESIDRIEVIKGDAARALYGEEGAAGVIQIFLKETAN